MSDKAKAWLSALALVLIFGLVSNVDYTYALEQENAALKVKNAKCSGVTVGLAEVAK